MFIFHLLDKRRRKRENEYIPPWQGIIQENRDSKSHDYVPLEVRPLCEWTDPDLDADFTPFATGID